MMSEAEGAARQAQNYAEIHFESRDGDQIMEPLKIFRAISEEYRIALPILNGYVLINKPQHLTRTMTSEPAIIKLVYAKIGSLHVYHGLVDMTGELIPLHNGDRPDQVAPVKLPDIDDDHHYYVMADEGIGDQVKDVDQYQPVDPAAKTSLVSLTAAEKQKVDRMERELSQGDNESILNIEDLKRELEEPAVDETGDPGHDFAADQADQSIEAHQSQYFDDQDFNPTVSQPTGSQTTAKNTPTTLLAQALGLICTSLAQAESKEEIDKLAESAKQLLVTIRTLVKLNQ